MNILNIHGFRGSSDNTNFRILDDAGYSVLSFQIDYESTSAKTVTTFLSSACEIYNIDLIVATSYGSYFANIVSFENSIPFIATNPCIYPEISLKNIAPEYVQREHLFLESTDANTTRFGINWERGTFITGDADEVIDHSLAEDIFDKATRFVVTGGHQLQRGVYETILLKEVAKHEKMD